MTEQQINETIATLNGWLKYTSPAAGDLQWFSPDGLQHIAPPSYTKDLNEVALLESLMSSTMLSCYLDNLCEMCTDGRDPDIAELVTMDAKSKCVAYLQAHGEMGGIIMEPTNTEQSIKRKFKLGDYVTKIKGSQWQGTVVGTYSTGLTPEGYCVESHAHPGSVQIYPSTALELIK